MNNIQKYNSAFFESFNIEEHELTDLTYQGIPSWDSVGHMNIIAALEETFDIMIDTEDIVDFNSYEKGKEILKKYDVKF